jgi:hypothetical protein
MNSLCAKHYAYYWRKFRGLAVRERTEGSNDCLPPRQSTAKPSLGGTTELETPALRQTTARMPLGETIWLQTATTANSLLRGHLRGP